MFLRPPLVTDRATYRRTTPQRNKTQQQTHLTVIFPGQPMQVSRYQNGKTNLDFTGARDSEWQWHQLGHMQVCTLLQTDNHASTPPLRFFTGRMPFLPPNQQRQSTEGIRYNVTIVTLCGLTIQALTIRLQCFDIVGWASGRAPGL